ncbi:hypothetical protein GZ77_03565 [Endozoicomonas montiporae]|uniref:Uncharacterized protein n=2 Tax=Endozoicomonas montiporae TaxID=1027273 RepID=A0A081NB45_9GAMM|nr:hypothetical protein [Endozoicomonas montiporae]AMO56620.1 hypothetical protein EZMO1_2541 [Endozoicomonas montiporae CL-33]KEQ15668.1 hypothetical protein GZ77_03565 [Endozoicomonas montiporae]
MPRTNNPTLGTIQCDACGGIADVCQAQRGKGRFLYTRCGECGTDQRTGKVIQSRLYLETNWRDGVEVMRPANVEEPTKGQVQPEPKPVVKSVVEPAPEPDTTEPKPVVEPAPEPNKEPKGRGLFALVATVAAITLLPFRGGM